MSRRSFLRHLLGLRNLAYKLSQADDDRVHLAQITAAEQSFRSFHPAKDYSSVDASVANIAACGVMHSLSEHMRYRVEMMRITSSYCKIEVGD